MILNECLKEKKSEVKLDEELKLTRENFNKVRQVDKAFVKLRFRIMAEANKSGNVLKNQKIEDNTINFIVPYHDDKEKEEISSRFQGILNNDKAKEFPLEFDEHKDKSFMVFQIKLGV